MNRVFCFPQLELKLSEGVGGVLILITFSSSLQRSKVPCFGVYMPRFCRV